MLTLFICFQEKLLLYPELSQQRPAAALAGDTLQCLHTHGERFYSTSGGTILRLMLVVHCGILLHSSQDVMMLSVPSAPMFPLVDALVLLLRILRVSCHQCHHCTLRAFSTMLRLYVLNSATAAAQVNYHSDRRRPLLEPFPC